MLHPRSQRLSSALPSKAVWLQAWRLASTLVHFCQSCDVWTKIHPISAVDVQLSQRHLWKRLTFLHWTAFAPLQPYMLKENRSGNMCLSQVTHGYMALKKHIFYSWEVFPIHFCHTVKHILYLIVSHLRTSLFWNLKTIMLSISFTVDIKRIND